MHQLATGPQDPAMSLKHSTECRSVAHTKNRTEVLSRTRSSLRFRYRSPAPRGGRIADHRLEHMDKEVLAEVGRQGDELN